MTTRWCFVVFLAFSTMVHCQEELELKNGKIKGIIRTSRDGRPYYSYTGIPYAKPPVGERRFKVNIHLKKKIILSNILFLLKMKFRRRNRPNRGMERWMRPKNRTFVFNRGLRTAMKIVCI